MAGAWSGQAEAGFPKRRAPLERPRCGRAGTRAAPCWGCCQGSRVSAAPCRWTGRLIRPFMTG